MVLVLDLVNHVVISKLFTLTGNCPEYVFPSGPHAKDHSTLYLQNLETTRETSLTVKDSTSSLQKRFNSMSEQVSEPMNMHTVELDT